MSEDLYNSISEDYKNKTFYPSGTVIDLKKYKELERCYFKECERFDKNVIAFKFKEKEYQKTINNLNDIIDLLKQKIKQQHIDNQNIQNNINQNIQQNIQQNNDNNKSYIPIVRITKYDNIPKKNNNKSIDKLKIIKVISNNNLIPVN